MKLDEYLKNLPPEKREQVLGTDNPDVVHAAFTGRRVVHAGLIGEAVARERQQETWEKILQQETDTSRQHAVYIHIPFCQTRCLYCSFYQNASNQEAEDACVDALLTEIARDAGAPQIRGAQMDSVFIGGGTPTSLSVANVTRLLAAIHEHFQLKPDCELTLEGRVHDVVPEKVEAWMAGGVNRISLGIQSFNTTLRHRVGRIDSREEVLRRLELLRKYDVTIIGDLIYGLPGETLEEWLEDVQTALDAPIDGMDLYQLQVFPGGRLEKAVREGKVPPCADIAGQADFYAAARDYLKERGIGRLSLCHWRKSTREQSLYNSMAKSGAVVYPFGCGAGGNAGGYSMMLQREICAYERMVREGKKPVMMMGTQVEADLQAISNAIVADLETGIVSLRRLQILDSRCAELATVLQYWCGKGLMQEDLGVYRLTPAGEFWYVSITQSLLECLQAVMEEEPESVPVNENAGGDALDDVIAELVPDATQESRAEMIRHIPAPVRMMLKRSSKEALKTMLAGIPPTMMERMLNKAQQ